MKRRCVAKVAPVSFTFDRKRFTQATREEFGELQGVDAYCQGGAAAALSNRFHDACDSQAITGPPGVEVIVYALDDSLIVAVREEELPSHLPVALRQLASYSLETKYVLNSEDGTFDEACAAIEELLRRASELLPSFAALRRGERRLDPDGGRRHFVALRRLLGCRSVTPGSWSG